MPPALGVGRLIGNADLCCGTAFFDAEFAERAQSQFYCDLRSRSACPSDRPGRLIVCTACGMTRPLLPLKMVALQSKRATRYDGPVATLVDEPAFRASPAGRGASMHSARRLVSVRPPSRSVPLC